MSPLNALARQFSRFSLVGVANTLVDFAVTNALYFMLAPHTPSPLLLISVVACLVATGNSFLLNSRWTFAEQGNGRGVMGRFIATAAIGMLVNTAAFLFLLRHLPMIGLDAGYLSLNIARLGGVLTAMALTFFGYRLFTFASPEASHPAPARLGRALARGVFPARAVMAIVAVGLLARIAFLAIAPVIYGDAVNYAWVARLTATGEAASVDFFWHSLFDYWQAALVWIGAGHFAAPVLASLLPGLALIWLMARITWQLYGTRAAWVAASLAALHPRLVEYSLNGYAETFYLMGAVAAVWGLVNLAQEPGRRGAALLTGAGLAAWILVRNEALAFAALAMGLAVVLAMATDRRRLVAVAGAAARVGVMTGVLMAACVAANLALWGKVGLLEKSSNLQRNHIEMIDVREAARETYGTIGSDAVETGSQGTMARLLQRWPANMRYTGERLPGMLLSPIFALALLLPVLMRGMRWHTHAWPLLLFTVWPLAFYPLIQLEPRMLFPVLIGCIIFGSAGAVLAGERLATALARHATVLRWSPAALVVMLLLPLIPLLAWHSGGERGYHRQVGAWLSQNVPDNVAIIGDGYGYISASAFWAARQAEPRIWTDTPEELANSIAPATVLVTYERYLREANPELLGIIDGGLPGMELVNTFAFPRVGRIQVWSPAPRPGWARDTAARVPVGPAANVPAPPTMSTGRPPG